MDFVNRGWLEYTGLSLKERHCRMDGCPSFIRTSARPSWRLRHTSIARGEPYEWKPASGGPWDNTAGDLRRWCRCATSGGGVTKWWAIGTDIEDLKRAEATLREHARLLDLTHDTVFVRDKADVITYWNRGAEALYGWSLG